VVQNSAVRVRAGCIFGGYRHTANRIEHFCGRGMDRVVGLVFLCHFALSGVRLFNVLAGIGIEFPFAAWAAEVVGSSTVLALSGGLLWIYLHSAHNVFFHR
jgi:hypothetical protein